MLQEHYRVISYNIKNVSSDYLRRRVLPVLPLLFVSGLARGNLGRYIMIPLRCNRRACRCLKLLALSSASRKPFRPAPCISLSAFESVICDPWGFLCNTVCGSTLFFNEFVLFRDSTPLCDRGTLLAIGNSYFLLQGKYSTFWWVCKPTSLLVKGYSVHSNVAKN